VTDRVEHDPTGRAEAFRPPRADELSERDWARLRSGLTAAVDGLDGTIETGLRLAEISREARDEPHVADGEIWYEATGVPLALALRPEMAAALVCVSLGSPAPDQPAPDLSDVDLAVLDVWARQALQAIAASFQVATGVGARRRAGPSEELAQGDRGCVAADLAWAGDRPAGSILLSRQLVCADEPTGPALAETPELLLGAPVTVCATIDGPRLPLVELLGLEVGDVVLLGPKGELEVSLAVGSLPIATGRPGARSERMAVRLTRIAVLLHRTEMPRPGGETPDAG